MKRLLILLIVLAGGLAAASFAVPSNAATVNGYAISQSSLDSDVAAIASSTSNLYGCFLNAEQAVATQGQSPRLQIDGVGQNAKSGPHTTATTAFVSTYLDTEIGHELVLQLAAQRHLVVTAHDKATALTELEDQITSVMSDVAGNTEYECGPSTVSLTGATVLKTMPASFVAAEVNFDATVSVLEEDLAGVGSTTADLERYEAAHSAIFDTACFTVAEYSTQSAAQAALAQVHAGASFASLASLIPGGGPEGCDILYGITAQLPAGTDLQGLPLNTVSQPIAEDGSYLLIEITKHSPTPFETARSEVEAAVQSAGAAKARTVIDDREKTSAIWVDPRYGSWKATDAAVTVPVAPPAGDVLNAKVNVPAAATPPSTATPGAAATPSTGQSG